MEPHDFTSTWYDQQTRKPIAPDAIGAHDAFNVTRCDCGARVIYTEGGNAAYCKNGHRWIAIHATIEQSGGWRQVP